MGFLDNLENSSHLESWARQKPKGYEVENSIARLEDGVSIIPNDGLAIKLFSEFCCDSCSCKSESDHTDNK